MWQFPRVTVVMMMVGGKVWHFQKDEKGLIQEVPEGGIMNDGWFWGSSDLLAMCPLFLQKWEK